MVVWVLLFSKKVRVLLSDGKVLRCRMLKIWLELLIRWPCKSFRYFNFPRVKSPQLLAVRSTVTIKSYRDTALCCLLGVLLCVLLTPKVQGRCMHFIAMQYTCSAVVHF